MENKDKNIAAKRYIDCFEIMEKELKEGDDWDWVESYIMIKASQSGNLNTVMRTFSDEKLQAIFENKSDLPERLHDLMAFLFIILRKEYIKLGESFEGSDGVNLTFAIVVGEILRRQFGFEMIIEKEWIYKGNVFSAYQFELMKRIVDRSDTDCKPYSTEKD
jgi:hypothetical protein